VIGNAAVETWKDSMLGQDRDAVAEYLPSATVIIPPRATSVQHAI
jgi:hypothetical protein